MAPRPVQRAVTSDDPLASLLTPAADAGTLSSLIIYGQLSAWNGTTFANTVTADDGRTLTNLPAVDVDSIAVGRVALLNPGGNCRPIILGNVWFPTV